MTNVFDVAKKIRKNTEGILDAIIYRWSPRSMGGAQLSEEVLRPLFEAARYAPSAFNEQPQRFYYAKKGSTSFVELLQLLTPSNQMWCQHASFLIILVSKTTFEHNGKLNRTHMFDTGAAWEAFAVEGSKRNLVVHGMSGFDYDKAAEYLNLHTDVHVTCMIAVGVPTDAIGDESISLRKPIEEMVFQLP